MELSQIEALYYQAIQALKQGKRPALNLSSETLQGLLAQAEAWKQAQPGPELQAQWHQWLCVVNYSTKLHRELAQPLLELLPYFHAQQDHQGLIYTLSALERHLLTESQRRGERLPMQLIKELQLLLYTPNLEVLEWVLKTIEQMGTQSLLLKPDILKIRPKFSLFSAPKQRCQQLIELIAQRWP